MALTKLGAGAYRSGSIIQTQYTQFTGTSTPSVPANTQTILTDLTVNITPNFTNSIIHLKVHMFLEFGVDTSNMWNHTFFLLRDSTKLAHAAASNRNVGVSMATRTYHAGDSGSTPEICSFEYFDSPSTTSQITYKVAVFTGNSENDTIYLNRTVNDTNAATNERGISSIIAQEIAG